MQIYTAHYTNDNHSININAGASTTLEGIGVLLVHSLIDHHWSLTLESIDQGQHHENGTIIAQIIRENEGLITRGENDLTEEMPNLELKEVVKNGVMAGVDTGSFEDMCTSISSLVRGWLRIADHINEEFNFSIDEVELHGFIDNEPVRHEQDRAEPNERL